MSKWWLLLWFPVQFGLLFVADWLNGSVISPWAGILLCLIGAVSLAVVTRLVE